MCGIAGIVELDYAAPANVATAVRMGECLYHRGPDAGGHFADGPVAFAHRRLKIIDLSENAAQPMVLSDEGLAIVYNGEIYNYREIRERLRGAGVRFRSESDTEVLLKLFAAKRERMLDDLNGIFSFAIWELKSRSLFAARDHYGVKPFYYWLDRDRMLFASEIKAILAGGVSAELDESRLGEAVVYGAVAGERTLFRGVRRLGPGCWLRVKDGRVATGRYFDACAPLADGRPDARSAPEAVRAALSLAVERQMVADVPVGTMCSGGLDSSAITALAAGGTHGLNTFCVRIPVEGYDESSYGRLAAEASGTIHHELLSTDADVDRLLPTLIWLHDEPLRHPNSIPIFQISRLARENVTVLLSGEGADEVFAGYGRYLAARRLLMLRRAVPAPLRPLARMAEPLAERSRRPAWGKLASGLGAASHAVALARLQAMTGPRAAAVLLPGSVVDDTERVALADCAWAGGGGDAVQAMLRYDQMTHLCTLLDRQDKMCMGASIESRVPFLDVDLVGLANGLPADMKLSGVRTKAVLRDALRDDLPAGIHVRPKHAFGLPLRDALYGGSARKWKETLLSGELVGRGYVSPSALDGMISTGRGGASEVLWNLLNIELWMQLFVMRSISPSTAELPAVPHTLPRA